MSVRLFAYNYIPMCLLYRYRIEIHYLRHKYLLGYSTDHILYLYYRCVRVADTILLEQSLQTRLLDNEHLRLDFGHRQYMKLRSTQMLWE